MAPEKVIYPLEHAYSPAELEFGKLTGVDAAVAALLKSATPQADCDLHLAVISIGESGSAECTGYRSYEEDDGGWRSPIRSRHRGDGHEIDDDTRDGAT